MIDGLKKIIKNLKREGVAGVAIIDKEGNVVDSDLPSTVHVETFGIMCATIVGAANSVNSELDQKSVKKTIIDSEKGRIIMANAGENLVLAVVIEENKSLGVLFDEIEKADFNPGKVDNERKRKHWERVYELSMVEVPDEQPVRVPFKHASFIAQTVPESDWETRGIESLKRTGHVPGDIDETGKEQVLERLEKARNWARESAPKDYRYTINFEIPPEVRDGLGAEESEAMNLLADMLEEEEFEGQEELDDAIFGVKDETGLGTGEFFETAYRALLSREQGPRLSRLILSIGVEETVEILRQLEDQ